MAKRHRTRCHAWSPGGVKRRVLEHFDLAIAKTTHGGHRAIVPDVGEIPRSCLKPTGRRGTEVKRRRAWSRATITLAPDPGNQDGADRRRQ